ncbi:hypothetical protein ANN_00532 [Periplaneta americana]|uniref:Uncharacterized protein n=1 Tax=Periplaneta americana TaxID=6978 RepID=A0ABQ8TSV1_PERAM|nr:hypothetical protein ANN_00532 [Periplaneta americana]
MNVDAAERNLNAVTAQPDALTVTPQVWTSVRGLLFGGRGGITKYTWNILKKLGIRHEILEQRILIITD